YDTTIIGAENWKSVATTELLASIAPKKAYCNPSTPIILNKISCIADGNDFQTAKISFFASNEKDNNNTPATIKRIVNKKGTDMLVTP
ncbi:hypothetical protein OFN04_30640, partial [Escherichia coli]|nr:hypothetical protein [Escherichia coli]